MQKVLLAISLLFCFPSYSQNDCKILKIIVSQYKKAGGKICLISKNDNSMIIRNFEELQKLELESPPNDCVYDNPFMKMVAEYNEFESLDSLRAAKGETGLFFSVENYHHFLRQQTSKDSQWTNCSIKFVKQCNKKRPNRTKIYISKPVYTPNNKYAVVYVTSVRRHSSYYIFYKDEALGWVVVTSTLRYLMS